MCEGLRFKLCPPLKIHLSLLSASFAIEHLLLLRRVYHIYDAIRRLALYINCHPAGFPLLFVEGESHADGGPVGAALTLTSILTLLCYDTKSRSKLNE